MTGPMLAIGYAALSLVVCFGAGEVYDAYKHRDHPSCNPRSELVDWSLLAAVWVVAVLVAHWLA